VTPSRATDPAALPLRALVRTCCLTVFSVLLHFWPISFHLSLGHVTPASDEPLENGLKTRPQPVLTLPRQLRTGDRAESGPDVGLATGAINRGTQDGLTSKKHSMAEPRFSISGAGEGASVIAWFCLECFSEVDPAAMGVPGL
jgi:hypothetical protein